MDILAALNATPPTHKGAARCNLAQFLDSIPQDAPGREDLIRLVESQHVRTQGSDTRSAQNVALVLGQLGFPTTQNPVLDHRNRVCRCYR